MRLALKEAERAFEKKEVPIGAIIISEGKIIAKAHNQVEQWQDVTAHAELLALTAATNYLGAKYLKQCTLYVTLEPCPMCAGALYWSQIGSIVYGATDEKRGFSTIKPSLLHPKTLVKQGILANDCQSLLKQFFRQRR